MITKEGFFEELRRGRRIFAGALRDMVKIIKESETERKRRWSKEWLTYNESLPLGHHKKIHSTTELAILDLIQNPPRRRGGIE